MTKESDLIKQGPLSDIRVIEMGSLLAGPFCGQLLGDFGAEVIKVELPKIGDPQRGSQLVGKGRIPTWLVGVRNKKTDTLDLHKKERQDIAKKLCSKADVVLLNFRPGVLEKWNLGSEVLHQINPDLIICLVSGFGQTGPYKHRGGFD